MAKDLEGAIADYTRAIELESTHKLARWGRAKILNQKGDLERAIADYTEAIERNPKSGRAWNDRGLLRAIMGDHQGAFADLSVAVGLKFRDALYNRGDLRNTTGDLHGAIQDWQQYLLEYPNAANAPAIRAKLQTALTQRDKAGADK